MAKTKAEYGPMKPMTLNEVIELADARHDGHGRTLRELVDAENERREASAKAYREETIELADGSKLEYGSFYDLTLDGGSWRLASERSMRAVRYDGRDASGQLVVVRYGATRMKKGFEGYDRPRIDRIYDAAKVLHAEKVEPSAKLLDSIESAKEREQELAEQAAAYRREMEEAMRAKAASS